MAVLVSTVSRWSTDMWYLTRAAGLVSLVLLSATLVVGIIASVGWTTQRWPRFLSQSVHRNLSLYAIVFVALHILSTIADGFVPISLVSAFLPFQTAYRPLWISLGTIAFDLLLAVAITSGLRRRIGVAAWRGVHWLAYACWPIAVLHGLGSGSDARLPGAILVFVLCIAAVVAAVGWRLAVGRAASISRRLAGAVCGGAILLLIVVFALAGPLQPGWAHRSGTSSALLAQIAGATSPSHGQLAAQGAGTGGTTTTSSPPPGLPALPFTASATGTVAISRPNAEGDSTVVLTMNLSNTNVPLTVRISGPATEDGVSMIASTATFGSLTGQVINLEGSTVEAAVGGPANRIDLIMNLSLDPRQGTLSGQVSGSAI